MLAIKPARFIALTQYGIELLQQLRAQMGFLLLRLLAQPIGFLRGFSGVFRLPRQSLLLLFGCRSCCIGVLAGLLRFGLHALSFSLCCLGLGSCLLRLLACLI